MHVMNRCYPRGLLVVGVSLCLLMGGCKRTHEDALKALLAKMNEVTGVLKGVTDEASAKAAAPKLKKFAAEMEALKKEMDAMPKPTTAEEQALKSKYETPLQQAAMAFMKETMRVASNTKTASAMSAMQEMKAPR